MPPLKKPPCRAVFLRSFIDSYKRFTGKGDKEQLFSIDWEQVERPPCNPEKIIHIKTDGKIWVVVARIDSDEVFYRSEDGLEWQQIRLDIPQMKVFLNSIDVINGVWIVKNRSSWEDTREEGIYYSHDALNWRHVDGPGGKSNSQLSFYDGQLVYENIVYFGGMWLWVTAQYKKYTYTEKGFFNDSTKTDGYRAPFIFCSQKLDGPWQCWDQTPHLSEGAGIKALCALPSEGGLLAFCEYDRSYLRYKKKPDSPPFVMYYGAGKSWQTSGWDSDDGFRHYSSPIISQLGGKLRYFASGEILSSAKGYDWRRQEATLRVDEHFDLPGMSLFTSNGSGLIHVSQDGEHFQKITLDDGNWSHLAANDGAILGVHYANKHEETVLRVGSYIFQAKA